MKKKTLLEIAKGVSVGRARVLTPTEEELDVVVAYLKGEVTVRQACAVLGMLGPGSFTHRTTAVLHWGLENKLIKLVKI